MKNSFCRATVAVAIIIVLSLSEAGCLWGWDCGVDNIQELSGLVENKRIISYVRNCGATTDYTVNVSFVEPGMDIKKETGGIFFASHGREIRLEKISPDTVKIIYFATDIRRKKSRMQGIYFIYEESGNKRSQDE